MYKLVIIGGKYRGQEYKLEDGENVIGRDQSCSICIKSDGVSKKHLTITVNKETAFLEDLGSSNGTFVNGKIVKKVTLANGDKVALPNVILQVVHVTEKKVIVKKKVAKAGQAVEENDNEIPPMPDAIFAKFLYVFKYKLMPLIYEFNKEYEWRSILAIILALYIVITISLTIFPVLMDNKKVLMDEIGTRGFHYAADIARLNAVHLSRRNLDSLNTNFLENEPGVESYELIDLEGRIVRPLGRLNEYTTDTFSIEAKELALNNKNDRQRFAKFLGDGKIGIAQTIKAYNVKLGVEEPVGVIAIKFAPTSLALEAANNSKAYLEAFTTSALVGIIFFALIYYLTVKHVDEIRFQTERVLRGKQKEVVCNLLWSELNPLKNTVNSLLQRYQEIQSEGQAGGFTEAEDDSKYVTILKGFLQGSNGPAILLNSEKLITGINTQAEDLTGIRESVGSGLSLLDVARDQGFAATVIDICDQCATSGGMVQQGSYEIQGSGYNIFVNALMGKDNFAKGYYLTFVKVD